VGANAAALITTQSAITRGGAGYFDWLEHVWSAAGCTRPVRLAGSMVTTDVRTGEIHSCTSTEGMPDGVIYKACGNRRATVCPSCAHTYQRDAYQLLRAGLVGGKGITEQVSSHPAVFATFTAPSFGPVHSRIVRRHTCTHRARCDCRAEPCHPRPAAMCPHGWSTACFTRHETGDPRAGTPICLDCYDHASQVVWNHHTGELWRRTKQQIERHLNRLARARGLGKVRVSHGKAAEFQIRGAVHFHALLRLDGVDPHDPAAVIPPPDGIDRDDLEHAVTAAAAAVRFTTPAHPDQPEGWAIGWGRQIDVRPITLRGAGEVTDEMVAGYLAKYATKSTEVTGHTSRRLTPATVRFYADASGTHTQRLVHACWHLGTHKDHAGLRRWAHMLGFGGHFLTKARRYSVTFRLLRAARTIHRRAHDTGPPPELTTETIRTAEHTTEETTLVVGLLTYAGTGWRTTADALLANTAADQARTRAQAGREELAHEAATQLDGSAAA
jgi:hypothetical protein